jgi:hypothetical protein
MIGLENWCIEEEPPARPGRNPRSTTKLSTAAAAVVAPSWKV